MVWKLHYRGETVSTNLDARAGVPGDVFTAGFQSAGRGRLDHRWLSPPGANLLMSAVLGVGERTPEEVSVLPLVVGLAVLRAVSALLAGGASPAVGLKWPNDVLVGGRKIAGILCERCGDGVIAGIGLNVSRQAFPAEVAGRAVALGELFPESAKAPGVEAVRDRVLEELATAYDVFMSAGFPALYPELAEFDLLRGRFLSVRQTDADAEPVRGICGGILADGSLLVGGTRVYAGEAHVERPEGRTLV